MKTYFAFGRSLPCRKGRTMRVMGHTRSGQTDASSTEREKGDDFDRIV